LAEVDYLTTVGMSESERPIKDTTANELMIAKVEGDVKKDTNAQAPKTDNGEAGDPMDLDKE
jgi:hypothetical protein